MSTAYQQPGVTINELTSPTFSAPASGAETVVALVGPARGYITVSEVVSLVDNTPVVLSRLNPQIASLRISNAGDPNAVAFVESNVSNGEKDYTLDTSDLASTGRVTLARSMQTSIDDGEQVVTYFQNAASPTLGTAFTNIVRTVRTTPTSVGPGRSNSTEEGSLVVQSRGLAPAADVVISNEATVNVAMVWSNAATVIQSYQTVWVDYSISGIQYTDQQFQLNGTTPVPLPDNAEDVTVKNSPGAPATTAIKYVKSTNGTDNDFAVIGTDASLTIARSIGSTTIGAAGDELQVRVQYQAVPDDYWLPTLVTSQAEVERKYGPALDSNGNIDSALSFAAGLAFSNGAGEMVMQALFAAGTPNTAAVAGSPSEWGSTLVALRNREDVNVIVPVLSSGGLPTDDTRILGILTEVQKHIRYMNAQDQKIIAIVGSDSTIAGQGSEATLRSQAQSISDERVTMLAPSLFYFINQLNRVITVGGQYAAAAVAGTLARYGIAEAMTRKTLIGLAQVAIQKDKSAKNEDAKAGLTVLENRKQGGIQIRHARTTDVSTVARAELNVVRCKLYMIEQLYEAIDTQIIGKIIADQRAPLSVLALVEGVLEDLVTRGIIVTYLGTSAQLSASNPTQVEVRFAYKPAFALNNVSVEFNIDLSTGTTTTTGA